MFKNFKSNAGLTPLVIVLLVAGLVVIVGGGLLYIQKGFEQSEVPPQVIGGDQDEHGCLIGAGYSWCDATQTCIRQWERYCTSAPPKVAVFDCDDAQTITATFYPADDQYVDLVLSDERALSVPRAISASGARYAKADESFVFWNKGDTAFITEDDTTTFANCVAETQ